MKIIDSIIAKFGNDKVLHFLGGNSICSFMTFIIILQENNLSYLQKILCVAAGAVVVTILSLMKELIIDEETNWKDCLYSVLGCIPVLISVLIGVLFNYLSY